MINVNDPKEWSKMDWSDPVPLKIRSDATINRGKSALGKKNNPEYSATMRKVASQRGEEHNQAVGRGCRENRDNTYQAECNARPEVQAKISKSLTGVPKSQSHKQSLKATTTNKPGNPVWEAAHAAGLAKRDRPFHTPYGVFPSLNAAARYVTEQGLLTNAVKKFEKWKKTDPANYYFEEKQ
jgi:hypothetical protein